MGGTRRSFARNRRTRRAFRIGILSVGLAFSCLISATAQIPPVDVRSHEWLSVEGERVRVVFPSFLLERGTFVASSLDRFLRENLETYRPERHWRYPVLLNPDMMIPNGFVATHPRRSVFYTMPDRGGLGDWLTQLSVHEGRHMTQIDAMDRNLTRALYAVSGENAFAFWMPTWWLEGDAVMAETLLTDAGRGRDPSFTAEIKALLLDGAEGSYDAMILGSRGRRLPDQYAFGYLMYARLRSAYDPQAPETLFERWSHLPLPALGADRAMRVVAGTGESEAWSSISEFYREFWKRQVASLEITPATDILGDKDFRYREYPLVDVSSDGAVIARRDDFFRGSEIVRVKGGEEEVLCAARPLNSLSEGAGFIVWDELEAHPKFARTSTRIVVRDPSGKRRVIARGSRYYGPIIDDSASKIAACEWRKDTSSRLVLLSPESGGILREYPVPPGEMWGDLSFSEDGNSLVFVSSGVLWPASAEGKRIMSLDLATGAIRVLFEANGANIGYCDARGDAVLFTSDLSGTECVYELFPDGGVFRVVSRAVSATSPRRSPDGLGVYFVDRFGAKGQTVALATLSGESRRPLAEVPVMREDFFLPVAVTESPRSPFDPDRAASSAPANAEPWEWGVSDVTPVAWGPSLAGTWGRGIGAHLSVADAPGTNTGSLSAGYDYYGDALTACAEWRYRGFSPDIALLAYGSLRDLGDFGDFVRSGEYGYGEYGGWASVSLPLGGGAVGSTRWAVTPALSSGVRVRDSGVSFPVKPSVAAAAGRGRFELSCLGFFEFDPREAARGDTFRLSHWLASASLGLPGVLSDDAVLVTVARENREIGDSVASGYVRGFGLPDAPRTLSGQCTYRVPLAYPEFPVGALIYVNMIRLDVFYDHTFALDGETRVSSAGAEVAFHFMPLRIPFELNASVRYSWIIETGIPVFQVLFAGIPLAERRMGTR